MTRARRAAIVGLAVLLPCAAGAATLTLDEAVGGSWRTASLVARDGSRHPAAELAFFGVTPDAAVVEIWPGRGYWTQILGPYLHDRGHYTLAFGPSGGGRFDRAFALKPAFRTMLDADPGHYGGIRLTEFGQGHDEPAPPGSADFVLTFRNLHNWMGDGDAPELLAGIYRTLKPGGVLGIEEHRANRRAPQDPRAASGYVREDYAIALIEKAGFVLQGSSEINANPKDTADWPKGVWTLPPVLALGATDRAKYEAIGEADNFVLRFAKPGRDPAIAGAR